MPDFSVFIPKFLLTPIFFFKMKFLTQSMMIINLQKGLSMVALHFFQYTNVLFEACPSQIFAQAIDLVSLHTLL